MSSMVGADVGALRELSSSVSSGADDLMAIVRGVGDRLERTEWTGGDGAAFKERWLSHDSVLARAVATALQEASDVLTRNAGQQERTSTADGASGTRPVGALSRVASAVSAVPVDDPPGGPLVGEAGLALLLAGHPFRDHQERAEENRRWWDGLPAAEQARMISTHASTVGQLDGLPSSARHDANTAALDDEIEHLEATIAARQNALTTMSSVELRGLPPELGPHGTLALYRQDLAALVELRRVTGRNDELLLLDLHAEENPVRAAVALGNPDTADYVSVHVAGTGSDVEKIAGDIRRATNIRDESELILDHEGSDGTVASVVWAGYDAPDVIVPEAMERSFADEGAPSFAAFGEGLRVATGPDTRITASGHSYGSTVVALGLQETDAFDAFVASGSPGFGTKGSLDVQVPAGQTYVSYYDMPGDLVAASGAHGDRPQTLPGVTITDNDPRTVTFADGSQRGYSGPGDTWYWQHSDYWDTDRAALFNQAAITVGRDELVAVR